MPDTPPRFNPLALIAAIALPGLGHIVRGEKTRGLCAGAGILSLFLGGIFIGGIDVVDSREDRAWFFGQALVGPLAFGVDYLHQNHFKVRETVALRRDDGSTVTGTRLRSARPDEGRAPDGTPIPGGSPPNRKSLGRVNELGTLYATIAGMVNLIVIIDAGFPSPRPRRRTSAAPEPEKASKEQAP